MPKVIFKSGGDEKVVDAKVGQNLLEVAQVGGVEVMHACGGNGCCSTCMCKVLQGKENLSPIKDEEIAMGMDPDSGEERLTCQAEVQGDVVVEIPSY